MLNGHVWSVSLINSRLVASQSSPGVLATGRVALSLRGARVQEARRGGSAQLAGSQMHSRLPQMKMRGRGCLDSVEQYAADRQRLHVRRRSALILQRHIQR